MRRAGRNQDRGNGPCPRSATLPGVLGHASHGPQGLHGVVGSRNLPAAKGELSSILSIVGVCPWISEKNGKKPMDGGGPDATGWGDKMLVVLVLVITIVNGAVGFALAVSMGHGPPLPVRGVQDVRRLLRRLLRLDRPTH